MEVGSLLVVFNISFRWLGKREVAQRTHLFHGHVAFNALIVYRLTANDENATIK